MTSQVENDLIRLVILAHNVIASIAVQVHTHTQSDATAEEVTPTVKAETHDGPT